MGRALAAASSDHSRMGMGDASLNCDAGGLVRYRSSDWHLSAFLLVAFLWEVFFYDSVSKKPPFFLGYVRNQVLLMLMPLLLWLLLDDE